MRFVFMAIAFVMSLCYTTPSFATATLSPKPKPKNDYIKLYLPIAQIENTRSTIPIAVIIGQGIFESGWGEASLATDANNHFGIKCGKNWNGPSYALADDDFDAEGNLIQSCFRSYDSAEHSFIDHSEFLMGNTRYESLFEIKDNDYKKWAYGLQNAGYATDTLYAKKLIGIIERYELYKYDGLNEPIKDVSSPFMEGEKFYNVQDEKLKDDELFEIESGKVNKEQNIGAIKVEDYEAPKAFQLPKDYTPFNRNKFDVFFKKIKNSLGGSDKKDAEHLDAIIPEKEQFQERGVNSEKNYKIIREYKVK